VPNLRPQPGQNHPLASGDGSLGLTFDARVWNWARSKRDIFSLNVAPLALQTRVIGSAEEVTRCALQ
jgi:hypothetical protein